MRLPDSKKPKMGDMTLSLLQLAVGQDEELSFKLPFEHDIHRQRRYVIGGFPILYWSNGLPWYEANAWLVSQASSIPLGDLSLATLHSNGYALLGYMRFVEAEKLSWNHLPVISAERAINRYRGSLIADRETGILAPSTASSRMGVIIRLYRWAQSVGILGGVEFEKLKTNVIQIRNRLGMLGRMPVSFSNLSIPNKTRKADVVEGGLLPLTTSKRDELLAFANNHASAELLLILKIAFFTGLRIGSICDLKLNTLEWAYPDADENLFWLHVGPDVKGAPVRTKHSINGRVLISRPLLEELKTYSKSIRRLKRESRADEADKQLLFINKNGKTYGRHDGVRSSQVCGLVSALKVKAATNGFDISDFYIHRARATFGTSVMLAGLAKVPKVTVSSVICFVRDLMLHKHESVTMTYIKFIENQEIKSAFADEYTRMLIGTFDGAA